MTDQYINKEQTRKKWGNGGEDGEAGGVVVDFEGEVVVTLEVVEDVEDQGQHQLKH